MTERASVPEPASQEPSQSRFPPDGVEVAKLWKSARSKDEAIVIAFKEFKGHTFLDCRIFFTNAEGQMRPTTKGITVSMRRLREFGGAIAKAMAKAAEFGLINDEPNK